MARATKDLTAKRVQQLREPGRYHDPENRGLYLQIGTTGSKSWLLRYQVNDRERWMGLGSVKDFSLKEARERARAKRHLLADGVDPIEAKISAKDIAVKEARERLTFKQATDEFLNLHAKGWKNAKHRAQWKATLKEHAFPKLGDRAVASIDAAMINDAVQGDLAHDARDGTARALNTCRRTLEALGLKRVARDVTPTLGEILREGLHGRSSRQISLKAMAQRPLLDS